VWFKDPEEIDPTEYDLALLHLDNWCDRVNLRAYPFRVMKAISRDTPQVIIIHGTPDHEHNRQAILRLIGDLPVVCNSHAAALAWDGGDGRVDRYGLPQFRAIIHGYDVDEFYNYPFAARHHEAFTVCSGGEMSREYHGIPLVERMMRDVPELHWYGPNGDRGWLPTYDQYRDMLSSRLIYFSPTRAAPMPGSRTEAMLSGCAIVTVPGNDFEQYIETGTNGFVVNTYSEAREALQALLAHPEYAFVIGQQGRDTARELFNSDRFVKDWLDLLDEIGVRA
jgi:glycosyltransferase involved in cell wall biosynthesis